MATFAVKAKHIPCGLHFTAYSWRDDWTPAHCPECGGSGEGEFLVWRDVPVTTEIFQFVPGNSMAAEYV